MIDAASSSAAPAADAVRGGRPDLFRTVGAAIHRRLLEVTGGDEPRARAESETLFVRFYLRFVAGSSASLGDEKARWAWIYRVGTIHALRMLGAETRPGGERGASAAPAALARSAAALPTMQVLRGFDEATQTVVVLNRLDGLPATEIAEVLELTSTLVERKLADAAGAGSAPAAAGETTPAHPSRFVLDRDRRGAAVAAHLVGCAACRAVTEEADRTAATFAAAATPEVLDRVARAIRAEQARRSSGPRWKRIAYLGGAFVLVTAMAFTVAQPRERKPGELPFRGKAVAAREKAVGLQITARRGTDVGALKPGMFSKLGDWLHFRVRAEGPRFLEVRVRSLQGTARIFPASGTVAVRVAPGDTLDRDYVIDVPVASPGHWLVIEGLFSEHEFPLDQKPGPDTELVPVRIDIEP